MFDCAGTLLLLRVFPGARRRRGSCGLVWYAAHSLYRSLRGRSASPAGATSGCLLQVTLRPPVQLLSSCDRRVPMDGISRGERCRKRRPIVTGGLLMSSEEHRRASGGMSAARRILGPRPVVMTVAAVCVLGVVLVLAQLVLSSQQASRSSAEQRFANGAVVRGQLTAALLSTSSASLRASAPKLAPNSAALDRLTKTSRLGYAALLSSSGDVIAISSGAPPAVAQRLAARPAYIRQALSGRAWISRVMPAARAGAGTIELAAPFASPAGRRVLVEGVPVKSLAPFLTSFLSRGAADRAIYVVDSRGHLIAASTAAKAGTAGRLPAALDQAESLRSQSIGGMFVASARIGNTGWQIVIAQPNSSLYP